MNSRVGDPPPTAASTPAWHVGPDGARLQLWPERAAYCPETRALLVADAHVGKAVSFRRMGVPVPAGTTAEALARLDALLDATAAVEIVFLGDLLHSARATAPQTVAAFASWRARRPRLTLTLIRGNHDAHAGDPPPSWGIEPTDAPLARGPWRLVHEPHPVRGGYALAGHVHPCAILHGRGGDRLRLACFHFGRAVGVLPAFGGFTGMHPMRAAPGERRYVIADGRVVGV